MKDFLNETKKNALNIVKTIARNKTLNAKDKNLPTIQDALDYDLRGNIHSVTKNTTTNDNKKEDFNNYSDDKTLHTSVDEPEEDLPKLVYDNISNDVTRETFVNSIYYSENVSPNTDTSGNYEQQSTELNVVHNNITTPSHVESSADYSADTLPAVNTESDNTNNDSPASDNGDIFPTDVTRESFVDSVYYTQDVFANSSIDTNEEETSIYSEKDNISNIDTFFNAIATPYNKEESFLSENSTFGEPPAVEPDETLYERIVKNIKKFIFFYANKYADESSPNMKSVGTLEDALNYDVRTNLHRRHLVEEKKEEPEEEHKIAFNIKLVKPRNFRTTEHLVVIALIAYLTYMAGIFVYNIKTIYVSPTPLSDINYTLDNDINYIKPLAYDSNDGLFSVYLHPSEEHKYRKQTGLVNTNVEIVVPVKYERLYMISDDYFFLGNTYNSDDTSLMYSIRMDEFLGIYSFIDAKKGTIISINFKEYSYPTHHNPNEDYFLVDTGKGSLYNPVRYHVVDSNAKSYFKHKYKAYKYNILTGGNFVRYLANDRISDRDYDVINIKDDLIFTSKNYIYDISSSLVYGYEKENNHGLISSEGIIITEPIFKEILPFEDGISVATTYINNKFAYVTINEKGEIINRFIEDNTEFEAENVHIEYNEGMLVVNYLDRNMINAPRIFDINLKPIKINKYNYISRYLNGYALIRYNDKSGIIDKKGKEVIAVMFDYLTPVEQGVALGQNEGELIQRVKVD